jgi:hypothetical protein
MTLMEHLATVKDNRRKQGRRYPLESLLALIIIGQLMGKTAIREIARFGRLNAQTLAPLLGFRKLDMPSHETLNKLVSVLDFNSVLAAFHAWTNEQSPLVAGEWLAADGKAVRSSVSDPSNEYQNFVSFVSLFRRSSGLVQAAQKLENNKEGEIAVLQGMLSALSARGVTITMDALHCQKKL